jgi:hypothetical protein
MSRRTNAFLRGAVAATVTSAALLATTVTPSAAATVPDHHIVICETASFYRHYEVGAGPFDLIRTLKKDNKVGHTFGVQGENNGWGYTQDFGPNDWGWMQLNCMSGHP